MNALEQSIQPSSHPPTLWFHHALLPHAPWHLTDGGQPYDDQSLVGFANGGFSDELASELALQRYLLQVKATDRLVGDLIDRLVAENIWDDALVVIHADHGVTFAPGGPYRSVLHAPSDLLPIPLFIKYPHQPHGRTDRRNAELIDVLPTIADVLGIKVPWKVDGASLAQPDPRRGHKVAWHWDRKLPPLGPRVDPTPFAHRVAALFGGARPFDLYAWGPHGSYVGRRVSSFRVGRRVRAQLQVDRAERFAHVEIDGPYLPARVSALAATGRASWVAVALNGRIAGLTRPVGGAPRRIVSAMLSPRLFRNGRNILAFYAISGSTLVPLS